MLTPSPPSIIIRNTIGNMNQDIQNMGEDILQGVISAEKEDKTFWAGTTQSAGENLFKSLTDRADITHSMIEKKWEKTNQILEEGKNEGISVLKAGVGFGAGFLGIIATTYVVNSVVNHISKPKR